MKKLMMALLIMAGTLTGCGNPDYKEEPVQPVAPVYGHHPKVVEPPAQ